jgi:hypothetical protein
LSTSAGSLALRAAGAFAVAGLVASGCSAPGTEEGPTPPRAAATAPRAAERLIEQGRIRREHGDELAARFYDALLARAPGADRPFYAWLRARLEPDREARRRALEAAAAPGAPVAGALADLGDLAFEEGRRDEARRRWEAAAAAEPGAPRVRARLAWLAWLDAPRSTGARERLAAARSAARAAATAFEMSAPRLADGFVAAAYLALGSRDRAAATVDEAIAGGLDDPVAHLVAARLRLDAGDLAGASAAFERGLLRAPPALVERGAYVRATVARVIVLLAGGKALEAEELAVLASDRFPEVALLGYAAAIAALEGGDPARAAARAASAAAREPRGACVGRLVAFALARAGLAREAALVAGARAP